MIKLTDIINELGINSKRIINDKDLLDWTNLYDHIENKFILPDDICIKYNSSSQEIIDNNMFEYLENNLINYLGKSAKQLFDGFIEYCRD